MKLELKQFQNIAIAELRKKLAMAVTSYRQFDTTQVISYTAPTGAGKTIIMSALMEKVFFGDEFFPEQPNAIFVWLSDSPELNIQSQDKIIMFADKIRPSQTVIIDDASFDKEILEDGKVYFLNTQKLGKSSNLTKHGDSRQWTIWQTLANSIREKSDRLYLIIDEAHRGAQGRAATTATTIMQKFVLGSDEDGLPVMPVIVGVSATAERFNNLVKGTESSLNKVVTSAEEVRQSGLLKDKIFIHYPDSNSNEMGVLQAAVDDWKEKCAHWDIYCREQHYKYVNPIMVVQVKHSSGRNYVSDTDLDACLDHIQKRLEETFEKGEVVHSFGSIGNLVINGLEVPSEEPSAISGNDKIRIVLFKENLSTGWDCPRAETMMSFRSAKDTTYIAQLLGRMVRTPKGMHIERDEILNEVRLFLPYFDESNVNKVIVELLSSENGSIPMDVEGEQIGTPGGQVITAKPRKNPTSTSTTLINQAAIGYSISTNAIENQSFNYFTQQDSNAVITNMEDFSQSMQLMSLSTESKSQTISTAQPSKEDSTQIEAIYTGNTVVDEHKSDISTQSAEDEIIESTFDREDIIFYINGLGLKTCRIRDRRIKNYIQSWFDMARLASMISAPRDAHPIAKKKVVDMIHAYVEDLIADDKYEKKKKAVLEFKLKTQVFDAFGKDITNSANSDYISSTDTDVDRQLRIAEAKLANEGIYPTYENVYGDFFSPIEGKLAVIIFTNDDEAMKRLHHTAEVEYSDMKDKIRLQIIHQNESIKRRYQNIAMDADEISWLNFELPQVFKDDAEGEEYSNHLFVRDYSGIAVFNLNQWEKDVIKEESTYISDTYQFVTWLRNPSRGSWALALPYTMDSKQKPMYPDFIAVRQNVNGDYILDILEPHDPSRTDNLPKAKGLAEYALCNQNLGRIELIRVAKDITGPYYLRLDLMKTSVNKKVREAMTDNELSHIFETDGYYIS